MVSKTSSTSLWCLVNFKHVASSTCCFFPLLSLLAWIGGHYANGILIWLSFLTLGIWGILALNALQMIVQLFTRHRRKVWLPLLAILLHTDYLLAVWQPSFPGRNTLPEGAQPLTVVTYNTTHFFWDRQQTMRDAAAYIHQLQPDIICMQEAPDGAYYQADTVRKAFSYVPHHCVSGRTDHLPMMIGSRYPLQHIRTLYFKNSVNLAMIADVCMPTDTVRLFCNHLETTSVNQYRGQIQAASKPWMFRLKAGVKLILRMKENFRKRAAQADYIAEEIRRSPYPVVVCGDFNDTPASYAYHRMKGALTDGFRDAGRGYQYTFRQLKRIWRIDYIFYSDELKGLSYDSPDAPYSDHKMVVWKGYKK